MIAVRFAPSPTGMLHIGGARTALFNWLYAKHHGGKFYLRIEDTDKERSTKEAVNKIFESLEWLGLDFDGDPIFQSEQLGRHVEVATNLIKQGKAYYCYCSPEELDEMRETAKKNGLSPKYNGYWRDRDDKEAPKEIKPVIRLKMPQDGETIINDLVQGSVKVKNAQLDDMILLRADGSPTYMLSVVVDDHDMEITHIIRGDDHLNNTFRQYHLYKACGWDVPEFAHIPLIHGPDGAKMSKRHGAVGTQAYQDLGILPEAMKNYLLRLGWSHGDEEIIPENKAIEWFDLDHVGRSASRFDVEKLYHLNGHYIKNTDDEKLFSLLIPFIINDGFDLDADQKSRIKKGMQGLKERAKTLIDLSYGAQIYIHHPKIDEKAKEKLTDDSTRFVTYILNAFQDVLTFDKDSVESVFRDLSVKHDIKLGVLAMALRIAVTGRTICPNLFEVISILGKEDVINRLNRFLKGE